MSSKQTRINSRHLAVPILAGFAFVAVGCSPTGIRALRAHPTPELLTSVESPTESANSYAIMKNLNLRMMFDDAARVIYIDRPSRLSPAPIPD